ncbi:MAG: SPOR domain-containing protein [Hyphomicrobiaceae bacterium]|nr:SPOR domain-containing protein [Hyphomicrobiaceae bacterium]MCC0024556.1 SPOR domain-containing protein [Hyphomicrobiaceae bacterium]
MENDKPSNPRADKSGGDLIEEMARLMARDASDSRPDSGISANDDARPSWRPLPATETPPVTPEPKSPAPEPFSARPDMHVASATRQEPSISGGDDAPSWMPRPIKPAAVESQPVEVPRIQSPEPEIEKPAPKLDVPQMEVPQMAPRQVAAPSPAPFVPPARTPAPEPQSGPRFEFDFGFDQKPQDEPKPQHNPAAYSAATSQEPQIAVHEPAPTVVPQTAAPVTSAAEDEDDPIAELIRAQLHTPPAQAGLQTSATRPSAPPAPAASPQASAAESAAQDRFSVSPVFGLGGKVAPSQAKSTSGSAALDEIESLIGNAVRLDGQEAGAHDSSARVAVEGPRPASAMPRPQQQARPQQAAPQARPQAAPQPAARQAPRPAAIEIEDNVAAAEAAIHAAMRDDVVETDTSGLLRDDFDDESGPVLAEGRARSRGGLSLGRWLVPVAALLLLGIVIYGIYAFISGGSAPTGDAPLISASNDPSKAAPEPTSGQGADQSVVLDGQNGDSADERLVSRDQSQENADPIRQIITAETDENGLANRKVRTVTVRPDGTIIQGDDQVAGSEELGVDRPNVPALPEGAVDSDLANTTVASLTSDNPDENASPAAATAANLVEVNGASVPYPAPRITDREAKLAAATPSTPATPTNNGAVDLITTAPAQTTQTSAPTSAAWVQLASQRSQGAAEDTAAVLTRQFGSLFNGQQLQIQRADLGDRGVFYRIMLPATSLTEATNICTRIQSAGGNCFPRNN